MKIETRFGIKDKVYPVGIPFGKEKFMVMDKVAIREIIIEINNGNIAIDYILQWERGLKYFNNHCFEQDCFATREEAEAECRRRNERVY